LFGEILKIKKNVPAWTLGKWILYMLGLLLCIAIGNLLFVKFIIFPDLNINFSNFLSMAYSTLAIGSIPVIFSGYFIQQKSDKQNQSAANDIQSQLKITPAEKTNIRLFSSNNKQQIELAENEFLYAESQQNYVAISHLKDGEIKETTLRNTLKNIQSQLPEKPFFRCHQSYLVNTSLIENISGNAQGLRLQLKGLDSMEIPVSRKYISALKAIIA
jgi:DNA-binding LytR/AlgR family response regulator